MHGIVGIIGFIGAVIFSYGTAFMILHDVRKHGEPDPAEVRARALQPTTGITGDGVPWVAGP